MSYHFGFIASPILQAKITKVRQVVADGANEPLYPLRDEIVHQINHELVDNMLSQIILAMEEGERKQTMIKIVSTVKSAADTLLNTILSKATNVEVMPTFDFMEHKAVFTDSDGNMRVGFQLDQDFAHNLKNCFTMVETGQAESQKQNLTHLLNHLTDKALKHFILDFGDTLALGFIKRKALSIAEIAVAKGIQIGTGRLLPQLDEDALKRLIAHFDSMLFMTKP